MDERINKIIIFEDLKRKIPVFAFINYTQRSFNGEEKSFTITERNEEGIKYYQEICARQNNCGVYALENIGKVEYHDVKKYDPKRNYFSGGQMLDLNSLSLDANKHKKSSDFIKKDKKKGIRITSLITAALVGIGMYGYHLTNISSLKNKAVRVMKKIEATGENDLLISDMVDLVHYVESENDDNKYQEEEIDLNNRVLEGLASDDYEKMVIAKAQGLFKNCFATHTNRYLYNQDDVYKYFMYMASLFNGGDSFGENGNDGFNVAFQMKNSFVKASEFDELADKLSSTYKVSPGRIKYSATVGEARSFKRMPDIMKKILMEQFITVCSNMQIRLQEKDHPSWWVELHSKYTEERVLEEVTKKCAEIGEQLAFNRENVQNNSKKH